jgi:uncharacterized coiled-coil protein SlyX
MTDQASQKSTHAVCAALIFAFFAAPAFAQSQTYSAITDRTTRAEPPVPTLGPAGSSVVDPTFGSRITRVTDGTTRPEAPNRSYRTPSSVHTNAWSADGRHFYVTSTHGNLVPFAFDPQTGKASRLGTTDIRVFGEPTFSFTEPGILYGAANTVAPAVIRYDLATHTSTTVANLSTLAGFDLSNPRTYVGGVSVSGDSRRLTVFFGGGGQGWHYLVAVIDLTNPSRYWLLDTVKSTLRTPDGVVRPTGATLGIRLHAVSVDRGGRYVKMTASTTLLPNWHPLWDVDAGTFVSISATNGGHDAYAYGWRVNNASCCAGEDYDAAQWQLRTLADPNSPRALISPLMKPKEVFLADHPSWHNAQPGRLLPFISATYRYGSNTTPFRAWDDEILGVQTDAPAGTGATVWRFAHHRSDVRHDAYPARAAFWYMPKPQVSQDGRWVLFTSNWEKTLGTDPGGNPGETARQDVFLLQLPSTTTAPTPPTDVILKARIAELETQLADLSTKFAQLSTERAELSTTVAGLSTEVLALTANVNALQGSLTERTTERDAARSEATGLLAVLTDIKTALNKVGQ